VRRVMEGVLLELLRRLAVVEDDSDGEGNFLGR
jgi:hypothetical protein